MHSISLTRTYSSTPEAIFKIIEEGRMFDLTGADDISFAFHNGGAFAFLFTGRGEIFGTFTEIIPNEKVVMNWNVIGFNRVDERDTHLVILIKKSGSNTATVSIENTGLKSEEAAKAKKTAWKEILEELETILEVRLIE